MTIREIRNELEEIYKERKSWNGAKGPFTQSAIRQRELILWKQAILYKIEDAKKNKDKKMEDFNIAILQMLNSFLNFCYREEAKT